MNVIFTYIGIIIFLFVILYAFRLLLVRYLRKGMPGKRRKAHVFKQINRWKDHGYNYNKRLELLIRQGYDKSVANILLGEVEYMSKPARNQKAEESSEEFIG
jgi:hypothetical protein